MISFTVVEISISFTTLIVGMVVSLLDELVDNLIEGFCLCESFLPIEDELPCYHLLEILHIASILVYKLLKDLELNFIRR